MTADMCVCFATHVFFDAAAGIPLYDLLDGAETPELFQPDSVIGDPYFSKVLEFDCIAAARSAHEASLKRVLLELESTVLSRAVFQGQDGARAF